MKYTIIDKSKITALQHTIQEFGVEIDTAKKIIENINLGNFDENDKLGSSREGLIKALFQMQENSAKVKKEESQRNWSSEGLAKFAEILRKTDGSLEELADMIISNLVKYLDANQGGLFVVSDENPQLLQLKASYAYDRKKYIEKEITSGEGLVGQCFIEKDLLYLTEIPQNYLSITSGLGHANPRALLIVPLICIDEIFGVLEIASFQKFEPHQIEFATKIAESIASTIKNLKVNFQTKILLASSQELTEQMRSQEEEIRQNMEELQATQEELIRKDTENQQIITDLRSEYEVNLKQIKDQEQQLLQIKKELIDKIISNNTLLDIAGRQRMLSQKIGLYAEMVARHDSSKIEMLDKAILLHEQTLEVMKNGGLAPGTDQAEQLEPADAKLKEAIEKAELQWIPFRNASLSIIELAKLAKQDTETEKNMAQKLSYIEDHVELLLQENVRVLAVCIEINKEKIIKTYSN